MADRDSFVTSRRRDYFSETELTQRLGFPKNQWALVLAKELIDNALDVTDSEIAPEITVTLTADTLTVEDNGPGLKEETFLSSINYDERVSTKYHYVSPTRGQLGNALMCVYAAPFVYNGSDRVDIDTVEQQSHGARRTTPRPSRSVCDRSNEAILCGTQYKTPICVQSAWQNHLAYLCR